jgi:hypothetical protein
LHRYFRGLLGPAIVIRLSGSVWTGSVGPEFLVNSEPTRDMYRPSVAGLAGNLLLSA